MPAIEQLTVDITQTIEINAAIGDAYGALIRRLTTENSTPDNQPMPMVLEEWPGGRWFRDLGTGQGHLWGFVQVVKPPNLIEIQGPMFMSHAVASHLQLRLTQVTGGAELSLRHQILGAVKDELQLGINQGWDHFISGVKTLAE